MNDFSNAPRPPAPLTAAQIKAWLDYDQQQLLADIEQAATQMAQDVEILNLKQGVISDTAELALLRSHSKDVRDVLRTAELTRKTEKDPFLVGGKTVDSWFRDQLAVLNQRHSQIEAAMNAFTTREEARRRAEAERAAEAARLEAEKLAKEAAAAQAKGGVEALAKFDAAVEAQRNVQEAEDVAEGRAATLLEGARETWTWRVEDISQVPVQYLQVNEVMVNAIVRQFGRDRAAEARIGYSPIPGIKLIRNVSVR